MRTRIMRRLVASAALLALVAACASTPEERQAQGEAAGKGAVAGSVASGLFCAATGGIGCGVIGLVSFVTGGGVIAASAADGGGDGSADPKAVRAEVFRAAKDRHPDVFGELHPEHEEFVCFFRHQPHLEMYAQELERTSSETAARNAALDMVAEDDRADNNPCDTWVERRQVQAEALAG